MYDFKRNIFKEVNLATQNSNAVFLVGPRKCGKTVCLRQIEHEKRNAKYINFKLLDEKESRMVFEDICLSIRKNEDILYLLDETTYAFCPEREIYRVADVLTEVGNTKTKIVFTGSQSAALESWANRGFCGHNSATIRADFLSYTEWLQYTGEEATEKSYYDFLCNVNEFYGAPSIEEYLSGCLEETIISNAKTTNYLLGNECNALNVPLLIDVCYAILFTLHNHIGAQTFFSGNKLTEDIRYYFPQVDDFEGGAQRLINTSFVSSHTGALKMTLEELKQSLLFLYRCKLITITPVATSMETAPDVYKGLYSDSEFIKNKNDLFRNYNFSIAYPSFYVQILKSILKENMPNILPCSLMGSINKCYIRNILPQKKCFEYHNPEDDSEVDYINEPENIAVEITIANKPISKTHFDKLPGELTKVLLSKDISSCENGVIRVPFYEFAKLCTSERTLPVLFQISEISCEEGDEPISMD